MPEHDALVLAYSHLRDFPRAPDALQILRRVASLVKPLMRARNWKVRELSEFYPDQANLLGLNINRGQKILLRLRYAGDTTLFLPTEQIADTMLHELAHIVHGPHDGTFHALWNQLRDEHMALAIKGYTGEGFLSDGHRLGGGGGGSSSHGHRLSSSSSTSSSAEARRLARAAAERRHRSSDRTSSTSTSTGGGRRLGGSGPPPTNSDNLRRVVADAVARRNSHTSQALSGCATDGPQYSDQTRAVLVEQALRNGFRTKAEEDAANDAAIAQALWEMVQEDEMRKRKSRPAPIVIDSDSDSDSDNRTDSRTDDNRNNSSRSHSDDSDLAYEATPRAPPSRRPVSMTTAMLPKQPPRPRSSSTSISRPSSSSQPPTTTSSSSSSSSSAHGWVCHVCTLHNPGTYLCCDACGTERRAVNFGTASTSASTSNSNSNSTGSSNSSSKQPSTRRHAAVSAAAAPPPPIPHATHPSRTAPRTAPPSSLSLRRPPPPPPPPSRVSAAAASAAPVRASAMAPHSHSHSHHHHHHRQQQPKAKKKVSFTPSTHGGSVTSATSSSVRARPPTPPGGRPAAAAAAAAAAASAPEAWMCTNCWGHMSSQLAGCAQCGKPRERWQGR